MPKLFRTIESHSPRQSASALALACRANMLLIFKAQPLHVGVRQLSRKYDIQNQGAMCRHSLGIATKYKLEMQTPVIVEAPWLAHRKEELI